MAWRGNLGWQARAQGLIETRRAGEPVVLNDRDIPVTFTLIQALFAAEADGNRFLGLRQHLKPAALIALTTLGASQS